MQYREEKGFANTPKQLYVEGLEGLIHRRQAELGEARRARTADIFEHAEAHRAAFRKMLGWPLVGEAPRDIPNVKCELLADEEGYTVSRMSIEVLPGLWMTGLLFKHKCEGKLPLVIVQHGGSGTPELISGVWGGTGNYNDMLHRVLRQGVHVFAPQLLLWNQNHCAVPYDRIRMDARLKRVGSSVTAVEIFGITRALDWFAQTDFVKNFGMVGLSYGGFYTLFTTAVETRIRSAVSCSFFNTRDAYPWPDWTWQDAAALYDDAEVACLAYPRRLCLEIGTRDELFAAKGGESSFARVRELCKTVGTDWIELIEFDGKHEFCHDDRPLERLAADLKGE
ncbi:MAG: hypothetical protein E7590_07335 [Ruminococcaceae bacterium]|nr:hypothetical protein [Oscillospiraceae bacterium]